METPSFSPDAEDYPLGEQPDVQVMEELVWSGLEASVEAGWLTQQEADKEFYDWFKRPK